MNKIEFIQNKEEIMKEKLCTQDKKYEIECVQSVSNSELQLVKVFFSYTIFQNKIQHLSTF